MATVMIHACPSRLWYVNEFLIPSLKEQGMDNIHVWNDRKGIGNLEATMASFEMCGHYMGGTWHIQDDVILCRDFVKRAIENDNGIVCGFANQSFGPFIDTIGKVPVVFHWWSFPCIRIPNDYAGECAKWWREHGRCDPRYSSHIYYKNGDDTVFRDWLIEHKPNDYVTNLKPCMVDHVDFLLGGSLVNKHRAVPSMAFWFEDTDLVDALAVNLATRASNAV